MVPVPQAGRCKGVDDEHKSSSSKKAIAPRGWEDVLMLSWGMTGSDTDFAARECDSRLTTPLGPIFRFLVIPFPERVQERNTDW